MSKIARIQISLAAFFAFIAVLLGALGAHALEETLDAREMSRVWETAVLYHLAHALALFALGIWSTTSGPAKSSIVASACWAGGIILFSGSLYALALGGPRFLGPITPLGGLLFLAGWVAIFYAAWAKK